MQQLNNTTNTTKEKESTQNLNFWVEYTEMQGQDGRSLRRLSARVDGKHYIGWLEDRESKWPNGETRINISANMKPCTWTHCRICYPELIIS